MSYSFKLILFKTIPITWKNQTTLPNLGVPNMNSYCFNLPGSFIP